MKTSVKIALLSCLMAATSACGSSEPSWADALRDSIDEQWDATPVTDQVNTRSMIEQLSDDELKSLIVPTGTERVNSAVEQVMQSEVGQDFELVIEITVEKARDNCE